MKLKDIVVFEPINLTSFLMISVMLLLLFAVYGKQLDNFMNNLNSIKINLFSGEVLFTSQPQISPLTQFNNDFNELMEGNPSIQEFAKSTHSDLIANLKNIDEKEYAVLSYEVNKLMPNYYEDDGMLKYLSIASTKVKFLAFYSQGIFVGAIEIEKVISGIASRQNEYVDFKDKLSSGRWDKFPDLISNMVIFKEKPTLKILYERLIKTGHSALPLIEDEKLIGFLDYKSISDYLYDQASPAISE